jgi:hypothetical protein
MKISRLQSGHILSQVKNGCNAQSKKDTHRDTHTVSTILNSSEINSVSQEFDANGDDYKGEKMRNMVLFFKLI